MINTLKASVVIRTYTEARWDSLIAAIEALQNQITPPSEIVVVVDHNPLLLERARAAFPDAVVVENNRARGSPGAWNSGIAAAKYEVIAFTDDDAVASPDWLERLIAHYNNPDVLGVGGAIQPVWEKGRPPWFPDEFDWVVGCTYRGLPQITAPVRNLIGCNMSFRKQVFDTIGGFREGMGRTGGDDQVLAGVTLSRTRGAVYFHGCDETELCIRLRQRWSKNLLIYEPQAKVYHHVPDSRASWEYFRSRCYLEGASKALLSHLRGSNDGLASERTQAFRVLPQGIVRGVRESISQHDPAGLARAVAIAVGLATTTAGYLIGAIYALRA
jgi:GT2 family glycosyltransferase